MQEILRQMPEKKYNELTVSRICEALDISRRTFYLHFQDIEDVFIQLFEEINRPLYEGISRIAPGDVSGDIDYLDLVFTLINNTIAANTDYLTRLAAEPSYSHIQRKHIELMKKLINTHLEGTGLDPAIRSVYLDYYLSGILELYFQWYRHEHDMSLDEIKAFALGIMRTDQAHFLGSYRTGHRKGK